MSQYIQVFCERLNLNMQRKNTHLRETISIESGVAMSLQRLWIRNTLYIVGRLYEVAKSAISKLTQNCRLVRVHL